MFGYSRPMPHSRSEWTQIPPCGRGPSDIDARVGAQIRARRAQLGLSDDELARALRISRRALRNYETGMVRPTPTELCAIATFLAVSIAYFFEPIERSQAQLRPNFGARGS